MINVTIDGRRLAVPEGWTVLRAAHANGINIPTLCHHKDLAPTGNCRLCLVNIKGNRLLQAACVTSVWDEMVVETRTAQIVEARREILALLTENHPDDCGECEVDGDCELQALLKEYSPARRGPSPFVPVHAVDSDPNPFIHVDFNRCILCRRCVAACGQVQVRDVWNVAHRGNAEGVRAGANTTLLEARCESCGQCVAYCPTGALTNKMSRGLARTTDTKRVTTTCGYCGVGCTLDLLVKDNRLVGVASNPEAPVNGMALCVKGRYGYDYVHHPDRLKVPRVRRYLLDGDAKPRNEASNPGWDWIDVDWNVALDLAAKQLSSIASEHGADALGFLTSAKCLNEENYLMNKLARQVFGTNNIDHCARL